MRAFLIAVLAAIAIAVVAWVVLANFEVPADAAFSTGSVRL